jgi:hypothetical protein
LNHPGTSKISDSFEGDIGSKLDYGAVRPDLFGDDSAFDDPSYFEEENTAFFSSGADIGVESQDHLDSEAGSVVGFVLFVILQWNSFLTERI